MTSSSDSPEIAGKFDVTERAITDLVNETVRGCYGVVGIGAKPARQLSAHLPNPLRRRPIPISSVDGNVSIGIQIVVEYGRPIATVARNVIQTVSFQLNQTLGLNVERVDVRVTDLRRQLTAGARTE